MFWKQITPNDEFINKILEYELTQERQEREKNFYGRNKFIAIIIRH